MRPPALRAPNPDYRDPRQYLSQGWFEGDGKTLRAELLTVRAMAMGRELLMRAVPLEVLGGVAREVQAASESTERFEKTRARLFELLQRPALQRYPCLLRLLQACVSATREDRDLPAFARHLQRVHQLAAFERVLGRAIDLERAADAQRMARHARLRAITKRRPKSY